jgi:hypothetical protein
MDTVSNTTAFDINCECGREYRGIKVLPVFCPCGRRAATPGFVSPKVRIYVDERGDICGACDKNVEGVCEALKAIQPNRPCIIKVGLRIRKAYCPEGKWGREDDPSKPPTPTGTDFDHFPDPDQERF